MAEVLISPGVAAIENDQSQITSLPIQAGAAIIGPTVKGKVNIPKLVTSYSEYVAAFGDYFTSGSDNYSFLTSISAYNYFQEGGTSLLVTRVQTGSFTPATSSFISSSISAYTSSFVLETLSEGTIMNSDSVTLRNGSIYSSGSKDNLRWEILAPNTSSGTFSVLIRRGNDSQTSKVILETFNNVNLDPKSPNYIARIIGDQTTNVQTDSSGVYYLQPSGSFPLSSKYVRVKQVNFKTPDYLDNSGNPKPQYTSSIPTAQTGAFGGATGNIVTNNQFMFQNINSTNTQGLTSGNYDIAISLLANTDEYKYNIITAPGLIYTNNSSTLNTLLSNVEKRGDAILVVDLENYSSTITNAVNDALSIDSSYAAAYWPWVQITDPSTSQLVWVPASTLIPGVYAANDRIAAPWFAPAGINRGGLTIVRQAERKLQTSDRDALYIGKVNPLATLPGRGVVVYGQKTLQTISSALDRVNVRRLLIELKSYISQIANNLVFEQNTTATRNQFLVQVNPYLDSVQQRQGLYAYKVVMDSTNNTSDIIDRNELVGAIYLQPTKTAEFIYLNFNITPTGVSF
jgi:hypothetical protein